MSFTFRHGAGLRWDLCVVEIRIVVFRFTLKTGEATAATQLGALWLAGTVALAGPNLPAMVHPECIEGPSPQG